jgi:putative heme-binding domain-containing protein
MHSNSKVQTVLFTVCALALLAPWASTRRAKAAGDQAPFGIPTRVPWTTSRIAGSPEPPPPYQTQRAYPKLTFHNPLEIAFAAGSHRIFVAEQFGKIYSFPDDENCGKADLFADLPAQVHGWEKMPNYGPPNAVYGFAFHPHFPQSRYVYICYTLQYTAPPGPRISYRDQYGTRVSRFTVSDTDPPRIDPASEVILLSWYAGGHNGGCVKFGPDGYLYVSSGDGGDPDPPDPFNTGQDISDLLCSILRIDVDHPANGKPYSIPPDNPFIHTPGARPEVYAYGLRNPWRMNFDRQTGNLWVGDVGWELWESIDCVKPGGNYGWSIMEGPNPVHPDGKRGPTPITPPAIALSHSEAASLTGGIVYHGSKLPELKGQYIFGDWQTTRLWAAQCNGDKLAPHRTIAQTDQRIVSFGEQDDGEPLIVDHQGGGLWRIVPNDQASDPAKFPRRLSETGLFASTPDQSPAPGVVPFSVNAAQWVDGATARRWIALPGTASMSWGKGVWGDDKPAWPMNSVLARTLSVQTKPGDPASTKNVETQVLHFNGTEWNGYSYAWNDQQTDAELVGAEGDDKPVAIADETSPGGVRHQQWHFGSRAQCMTCHNVWADFALAFNLPQLDRMQSFDGVTDNQVRTFRHIGMLLQPQGPKRGDPPPSQEKLTLTDPYDSSANLNERARSYLHVNCSHCHRFGGGGSALFDVRKELPLDKLNLVDIPPNLGNFNIDDARLACAGDPARSVLLYRMAKLGRGRMPHIGSDAVDSRGIELIREWITAMPSRAGNTPPASSTVAASSERAAMLQLIESPSISTADAGAAIDRLLTSTAGALSLVCEIQNGKVPSAICSMAMGKGIASSQEYVRDLFRRFDPKERSHLGTSINAARLLALRGDVARGKDIFFGGANSGLCARCHRINNAGADFGPDLSHISTKYNRYDILDNILYPSKTIAPEYITYVARTKSGDTFAGFVVKKTATEIVLKDAQLKELHIPTADIQKLAAQSVSAMPEGLLADLEPQQAADLLEYLSSLK